MTSLCRDGKPHEFIGSPVGCTPLSWRCVRCGLVLSAGDMEARCESIAIRSALARIESALSIILQGNSNELAETFMRMISDFETDETEQALTRIASLEAERDKLRAAIDEAPHDEFECAWVKAFRRWQSGPQSKHDAPKEHEHCTCWKRAVLK